MVRYITTKSIEVVGINDEDVNKRPLNIKVTGNPVMDSVY